MSLLSAKVIAVNNVEGRIALTVRAEGERIDDIALIRLGGDEHAVAVDSRVMLLPLDGADGEYVALPLSYALRTNARVVQGPSVILADVIANAVALALKSDVQALVDAIANAAVLAGDGGATFKSNILAALGGIPVGTQKVTAE